ncbi:retrovirus-related pol polyprotein from transposon TNT 1-94 [Tanacetum coccineum]
MEEEMDSLRKNKTWELVDHPAGQKVVSCIWLFRIKEGIEGVQKPRYKARLVARRFTQRAGIDYNEVFSPIVRHTSIQSLLKKEFDMKELGEAKEDSCRKSVKMPLSGHFKLSLKDCSVKDCDVKRMSKVPYANAVGSLILLMGVLG